MTNTKCNKYVTKAWENLQVLKPSSSSSSQWRGRESNHSQQYRPPACTALCTLRVYTIRQSLEKRYPHTHTHTYMCICAYTYVYTDSIIFFYYLYDRYITRCDKTVFFFFFIHPLYRFLLWLAAAVDMHRIDPSFSPSLSTSVPRLLGKMSSISSRWRR